MEIEISDTVMLVKSISGTRFVNKRSTLDDSKNFEKVLDSPRISIPIIMVVIIEVAASNLYRSFGEFEHYRLRNNMKSVC